MMERKLPKSPQGWYCGNCKLWHAPDVKTCPKPPRDERTLRERIQVQNG